MFTKSVILQYLSALVKKYAFAWVLYALIAVAVVSAGSYVLNHGFDLFGPSKGDLKVQTQQQGAVIETLENGLKLESALGDLSRANAQADQKRVTDLYAERENKDKAYTDILNQGNEAFKEANKPLKHTKVGDSSQTTANPAAEPLTQASALDDPHSPTSLTLAQAQLDMVQAAYCLASGCAS